MGLSHSPRIVTNGLVAYWDAANIRSYRYNLLSYTNNLSSGYGVNGTLTTGQVDPNGGLTATKITATNTDPYVQGNANLPYVIAGQTYNLSIWMKGEGTAIGKNFTLALFDGTAWATGSWQTNYVITSGWQRVSQSFTPANSGNAQVRFDCPESGSPAIGDVCYVWGFQLSGGPNLLEYLPNATTGNYTTWTDLSGNGNSMTMTGTLAFANGAFTSTANISNYWAQSNFNHPTTEVTIEMWISANSGSAVDGLWSYAVTASYNHGIIYDQSNIALYGPLQNPISSSVSINDGNWHHLVKTSVRSTGTETLYIDGVFRFSGTVDIGTNYTPGGTIILGQEQDLLGGGLDPNQALEGKYSVVKVYNRALSASEVNQNFNALRGRYGL